MFAFNLLKIAEQLADAGVGDLRHGFLIETARLQFHDLGLLAYLGALERTRQPEWTPLDETLNVLATHQRDVLAEAGAVGFNEHGPMIELLFAHIFKQLGGGGIGVAKTIGEVGVYAAVLFLQANGERQNFALG